MRPIHTALRRFARDLRGNLMVEAVIFLPILCWTFVAVSVGWDAYRDVNLAQKATFTVADIISRERGQIRQNYLINYLRTFAYVAEVPGNISSMNAGTMPAIIRVTSVIFAEGDDDDDGEISVMWSMSSDTGRMPAHNTASIQAIKDKIPAMLDGDNIVVVETRLIWSPSVTARVAEGMLSYDNQQWFTNQTINTLATVRPRFVPKVCAQVGTTIVACEL